MKNAKRYYEYFDSCLKKSANQPKFGQVNLTCDNFRFLHVIDCISVPHHYENHKERDAEATRYTI